MASLTERLDQMEAAIRKPSFRQSSGRANEVNYWVFDYPPEKELEVRERIEYLKKKNRRGVDGFELVVFDLYDIIIDYLEKEDFLEQCYRFEKKRGIGMTEKLALPTLIALSSIALNKPTVSSLAVLGEISISGTLIKVDELANSLQVCLDSGAKKVLLPIISAADLGTVPPELVGSFNLIFYSSAEDAVFKALGVE